MADDMHSKLAGRVALVTGAARGIGRATAVELASSGADLIIGLRNLADDAGVVDEVKSLGRNAFPVQLDISQIDQITSAVAEAHRHYGRIDILVNNAGRGPGNPAEKVRGEDFDFIMSINVKGTFFMSQTVGRIMIDQRSGSIVNIGSQAGHVALPGESVYCISKAAVSHLTKCLAIEWGEHGIRVNAVSPTFINTRSLRKHIADPERKADIIDRIAGLHRIGEASEVASVVRFLASDDASLVTGETIMVDGGWTAR